jgi:hypothetical protein
MSKISTSFPFERINFIIMLVGIVVIGLGYLLMVGGGSDDPNVFSEEIFSFRRLTLAPIVILLGFAIEVVAILYTPKNKQ